MKTPAKKKETPAAESPIEKRLKNTSAFIYEKDKELTGKLAELDEYLSGKLKIKTSLR